MNDAEGCYIMSVNKKALRELLSVLADIATIAGLILSF